MGGLNAPLDVEDTITLSVGFDATPFWQGEVSPLLARADAALYVAKRKGAILLRWRRSCWFSWPEREGKFERGAVKSSAQKVHHLTAPVFALLQRIADFGENGAGSVRNLVCGAGLAITL